MNREVVGEGEGWVDGKPPPTPPGGCAIVIVIALAELAIVTAVVLGMWASGLIGP